MQTRHMQTLVRTPHIMYVYTHMYAKQRNVETCSLYIERGGGGGDDEDDLGWFSRFIGWM